MICLAVSCVPPGDVTVRVVEIHRCEWDVWVPGTAGTAWWHPIGRQAPYQICEGCSGSRKTLFFLLFAQQGPPSGSTVPTGATFHFWALGATIFSSLRNFRKTAFSGSLTSRFK